MQSTIFNPPSMDLFQQYIHISKYARWREDLGRRETWMETVQRYVDFFDKRFDYKFTNILQGKIKNAIYTLQVMPSMRCMMTAGTALDRENVAGFNCAYLAINTKRSFAESLYILMCGTGVGFSCENEDVTSLPLVPASLSPSQNVIVVGDSKKGWAKALNQLLAALWDGDIPQIDYSKIRPAGAPLKTFGGRASGPEPLKRLFDFSIRMFRHAANRKLLPIEVHDLMCMIGEIVVVGGVRRSALISLSDLYNKDLANAKSNFAVDQYSLINETDAEWTYTVTMKRNQPTQPTYKIVLRKADQQWLQSMLEITKTIPWFVVEPQRGLSNNSVAYTEKPDAEVFLHEWLSLVASKSGERGIFNREAARKQASKWGRRRADAKYGCNPCCVVGETKILTDRGYVEIKSTVGSDTTIWNGKEWSSVVPFAVGTHPTLEVLLSNGATIRCTENHKFLTATGTRHAGEERVEAKDLVVGQRLAKYDMPVIQDGTAVYGVDAYSQGFYSGDGTTGLPRSWLYEPKYMCKDRLIGRFGEQTGLMKRVEWIHGPMLAKDFVPLDADLAYKLDWLAGVLDSDGSVTRDKNGCGFQIASIDKDFLNNIRLLLTTIGVQAKVVFLADAGLRIMPDGKGGEKEYQCKETNRICIGNAETAHLASLGLKTTRLQFAGTPQRSAGRFITVKSVTPIGQYEHFCFDEPKNHSGTFNGVVTGQSEIILRDKQFCNLSEVVARADDTIDSLAEKVEIAAIIGTMQASLTKFDFLSEKWEKNTREEALLGVSITGIYDNELLSGGLGKDFLIKTLDALRNKARSVNEVWAPKIGVNVSAAITCTKPSGTVSQLVNSASGIHPRHNKSYIRTVRIDKKDPLYQFMLDKGFPIEDDMSRPKSTAVVSFPITAPEGCITRDDVGAIESLEIWLIYQRHWCEHKPSVTITVRDEEWMDVAAWVYKNFDEISGVSFLPHSDHTYQQAPYQDITAEQLVEWTAKNPQPTIDWTDLAKYEIEDNTISSQTLACVGGVCELN